MKKIVTLLICALLIAALAIPALAADETVFTITADKATAAVGDVITLTVSVSGSDEINAGGIIFTYDSNVFELVLNDKGKPYFEAGNVPPFMTAFDGKGVALMNLMGFAVPEGVAGKIQLRVIAECPSTEFISGNASAKAGTTTFPTTVNGVSINITGEHSFGAWTPKGDNHAHTCSKCGAEETGAHNLVKGEVTQQPNCTVEGKQNATCSDCGLTTSVSIPTNDNHSWNAGEITTEPKCGVAGVKTYTCQHNAEHTYTESVPALEHKYDAVVTAPTCTEKGYTTYTCSLCGNSYVDNYVDATGHKMGQWVVVTDSTCTAVGEERSDCSACDHFETREIPVKAHDYVNAVVTAPTCTEKGYTTRTCVCGASIVDTYVNPTGHKFEKNWQIEVAPTCTEKGEERDYCANGCGEFNTQSVPATGHTYNEGVITTAPECEKEGVKTFTCIHGDHSYTEAVPATGHTPAEDAEVTKEPTCTEKGEMSGKCAVCGKVLEKQEIPALGHKWGEWTVTTPATCTAKGVETRECATCHETETKSIEKIPHDLVATVTAPTCTAQGFTTYNCKNCDHSETAEYVKATGHQMGEWTVTKDSTCIEQGEQRRDCANCDHFETEKLPLAEHKYEGTKVEPTCTEPGKESGKCSVCGDEVNEKEIPALGHDFGEYTVTTEPGCETEGEKTASCSRCDATDVQKIAATGHTFGDWIKVDEKNHKHVCACGHEETVAHNWDSGNVVTPATHSATGLKRFECKDCHATREEELAKLNKHDDMGGKSKPIKNDKDEPDKKYHTAVCTCGEEHKEEHSYTFIEIIEEATEGKKGKKLFRCDCGVEDIVTYRVDGTLDNEPGTGDITGQVVMTGVAAFSMMAAAAYVFIRKRTA